MSHTPLPWAKDYGNTKGHIKAVINKGEYKTPTVCRYDVRVTTISKDEQEANAEMIVKAVNCHAELVAVVKMLLPLAEVMPHGVTHDGLVIADKCAKARGVLRKAGDV